jgi:hypothetical protein
MSSRSMIDARSVEKSFDNGGIHALRRDEPGGRNG